MKKILLDENKNYYKANLHCHSTISDGKMTVEELKEHYMKNGYSIIAFTDHEHIINNSHLTDDNFLAITACEVAIKEIDGVSTSKVRDMKVCHLNFYAKEPDNIDTPCYNSVYDWSLTDELRPLIVHSCGEYKREYSPEKINEMIRIANEKGFLVSYNHPRWSLENATDYLNYEGIWAVEIYNNESNYIGIYEYDINVYDDFLRAGKNIACMSTDDNHRIETTCGGFVMINADKLDYPTIIGALENHDFYASTGPVIKSLYVEDDVAHMTFEAGEYAVMSTKGRRVDKQLAYNPDGENEVQFKILPDQDGYIRFDVVDKFGRRANTCAYMVEDLLK